MFNKLQSRRSRVLLIAFSAWLVTNACVGAPNADSGEIKPQIGQPDSPGTDISPPSMSREDIQAIRNAEHQLRVFQKSTIEQRPQLQSQARALSEKIQQKLSNKGMDYPAVIKKLESIESALNNVTDNAEREELIEKFNQVTGEITDIELTVRQDPKIQEMTRQFQTALRRAMHELYPESREIEQELNTLRRQ